MLSLLATILSWTDPERERAGLQRAQNSGPPPPSSFWGRSSHTLGSPTRSKSIELEKTDETEVSRFFLYGRRTLNVSVLSSLDHSYIHRSPVVLASLGRVSAYRGKPG